ncbi:NAD(P)H-dependent oxidoreductase [Staphylococcus haemolyticus]
MTFWPNKAFSFKNKQYYKNGLWKDKKAIVIYTIGGSEWFNLLNLNLGYRVLKYPLNLVGISNIKKFYIDQLNRSNKQSVNKKVNSLVEKVMKSI